MSRRHWLCCQINVNHITFESPFHYTQYSFPDTLTSPLTLQLAEHCTWSPPHRIRSESGSGCGAWTRLPYIGRSPQDTSNSVKTYIPRITRENLQESFRWQRSSSSVLHAPYMSLGAHGYIMLEICRRGPSSAFRQQILNDVYSISGKGCICHSLYWRVFGFWK